MAGLFKNKIIKEKIERYEIPDFEQKISLVQKWSEAYKSGELHKKNETQCEQAFNQDFFIDILGYSAFPNDNYTIQPKANVESGGGQMPDATLGYFNKDIKRVVAVVEIKDVNTFLDKSQYREGNLSPIQQAFKYKPQYKECGFVIATNFFELRLFRDNQLDYEKFTLTDLIDPKDDYFNFRKFFFLLNVKNFVTEKGQTETELLLSAIRIEQEKITNRFYTQYKELRESLITDIVNNNKEIKRSDFYVHIVEKAQKIVDRIVFICFFEDAGLLPENRLTEVVEYAQKSKLSEPIWDTIKKFFKAVDEGSERLGVPNGYNGELFKPDNELDNLKISDAICKRFVELSKFDFQEDLSVNILGHIFEQSITDLERLKQYSEKSEITTNKKDTKRKKDGIFYTPEYIVDYIVKNSLGKYLQEKEQEILQNFNLDDKRTKEVGYNKKLVQAYAEYSQFLRNVKVLDPACGSGAFLVKVFDYLLAEHKRVFRIVNEAEGSGSNTSLLSEESYIKRILENNIYGVDLNPESVEITKLSLWLKSAQKGQKLITLKGNIKCGNSLIDDPKVAGERAFNWATEFAPIMDAGGFDVVVGNPPYGVKFSPDEKKYLEKFDTLVPDFEIYIYFISKGLKLLRESGYLGYIFPNTFLSNTYGIKYRQRLLVEKGITSLTDLSDDNTFRDASVRTCILVATTRSIKEVFLNKYDKSQGAVDEVGKATVIELEKSVANWLTLFSTNTQFDNVFSTMKKGGAKISDYFDVSQGLIPYDKYQGHDEDTIKNRIWHSSFKKNDTYKPELEGVGVKRYSIQWNGDTWISYGEWLAAPRDPRFFTQPRVLVREIAQDKLFCAYTEKEYYNTPSIINIVTKKDSNCSLKVLTALLNSTVVGLYSYQTSPKAKKGLFPKILVKDVRSIPIPVLEGISTEQIKNIEEVVDDLISLNDKFFILREKDRELLRLELGLEKLPTKLNNFYELTFEEILTLSKSKLSLDKKSELMDFFTKQKNELQNLNNRIVSLDQEIDELVYKIYGLTQDEIKVVEDFKKQG